MKKKFTLPTGQKIKAFLHKAASPYKKGQKLSGHYLKVDKTSIGFFKVDLAIYVFLDCSVYPLSTLSILNTMIDDTRVFTISSGSEILLEKKYKAERNFDINPFWPTDEEDVDNLLWFYNVLTNTDRIEVIKETCSESLKV